uniref:Uncharacterized protein n=1 Tax=Rhizophora mucronata TaxID=61149 RepID=A0A2P2PPC9_RHIMU
MLELQGCVSTSHTLAPVHTCTFMPRASVNCYSRMLDL